MSEYHLKRNFGITEEQYQQLYSKQKGRCFICQRHSSLFVTRLAVDHNHKTGEIRGLLCFRCNKFRVGRNTDLDIPELKRLVTYLKRSTGWFVPEKPKRVKRKRR